MPAPWILAASLPTINGPSPGRSRFHVVLLFVALTCSNACSNPVRKGPTTKADKSLESGSLAVLAIKARSEGKTTIEFGAVIPEYGEPEPLDAAIKRNTIVIAELITSESTYDENQIYTIRKYRIIEHLASHQRPLPADRDQDWRNLLRIVPRSMLPITDDQFVMNEFGGSVTIGGIRIVQGGDGMQNLPPDSSYLMFVLFDSTVKVAPPIMDHPIVVFGSTTRANYT